MGVPQASFFEERAVIDNGGTAFLEVGGLPNPGGIDVVDGKLEIRRGGSLVTETGVLANGTVTVGTNGQLVIGELTGGPAASLSAVAAATIQGTLSVIGPNSNFSAASISLPGSLHTTITAGGSSAITTAGTANLNNGTLQVTFDGFTPSVGVTYDILDAGSINGNFSQIIATGSLAPGLFLDYSQVAGGTHGNLGQVAVDAKLVLSINRRTGQAVMQNLTTSESIDIDGYLITSLAGSLNPTQWHSFHNNGFPGFRESNPSALHMGELNLTGSRVIGPETNVSIGSIYSGASTPLSPVTIDGDVAFEYHLAGGTTKSGVVEYFGAHNNLVLVVSSDGQTFIQNQSTVDIELDGYLITSLSSSLNAAGWTSFASSDSAWRESNPADNHLGELNLGGSRFLAAESSAIDLGNAFSVDGQRDLNFTYHIAGLGTFLGTVEYDEGVVEFTPSIPGDYDNNGTVELADYTKWRQLFGSSNPEADGNNDNVVNAADYVIWRDHLGQSAGSGAGSVTGTAVPEPAAGLLWLLAIGAMLLRGRRSIA